MLSISPHNIETVNDNGKREKIYIIETPEMTDNDTVGIGVPDIVVAKNQTKQRILF